MVPFRNEKRWPWMILDDIRNGNSVMIRGTYSDGVGHRVILEIRLGFCSIMEWKDERCILNVKIWNNARIFFCGHGIGGLAHKYDGYGNTYDFVGYDLLYQSDEMKKNNRAIIPRTL